MSRNVQRLFAAAAVLVFTLVSAPQFAQAESPIGRSEKIGVGVGAGPLISGVSGKFYLDQRNTIQALLGTTFYGGFGIEGNFVHEIQLTSFSGGRLDFHVGGGLAFRTFNYYAGFYYGGSFTMFGPNGVIGLGLKLKDVPLEFATEWHPGLYFGSGYWASPYSGFYYRGGAFYARWYF